MNTFEFNLFDESTTDLLDEPIYESEEMGPVNANTFSEKPTAKPYDANSISVPNSTTITADVYNKAIDQLQKTLKESAEILGSLQNMTVVDKDLETLQEEFTEACILKSYEDGPFFEKVVREDKEDVKKICRQLRESGIDKFFQNNPNSGKFYWPNKLRQVFTTLFSHRLWQIVGCALIENNRIKTGDALSGGMAVAEAVCDAATKKFSNILGKYRLIPYMVSPSIADVFRAHWGIKDTRMPFFIIVDNKVDAEIKKDIENASAKDTKAAKESNK